ncbi:MAG: Asp23/Gls24 family envelope stress response protein [Candidatus Dormibacteraeota bacterium]|uniref:Asp23/Gls24 family envelope stress response protein n=1 Tax=Candidatus Amunia macphersoniae TaxID=3127014 RepID=A0A934KMK1_9BACT|nr:Asp23/Gls24 family envelope stress response protein [Candidatus Dormibacteraeota bacterium]
MAMNPNTPPTTHQAGAEHPLACGCSVEQVWDDMQAGHASAHAADCPHCLTARASLEQMAEATRLLIDEPVNPPSGLLDQIMNAVRADLARGDAIALPALSGTIDISASALAAVLRFAVDGVDGVRAHRCRIVVDPTVAHTVRVWMSVSLRYGSGEVTALDQARQRVGAALSARIGLVLDTLDFEVTDVWIADAPGAGSEGQP